MRQNVAHHTTIWLPKPSGVLGGALSIVGWQLTALAHRCLNISLKCNNSREGCSVEMTEYKARDVAQSVGRVKLSAHCWSMKKSDMTCWWNEFVVTNWSHRSVTIKEITFRVNKRVYTRHQVSEVALTWLECCCTQCSYPLYYITSTISLFQKKTTINFS